MKIILASNSLRRKEILLQIGLEFEVIQSDFKESINNNMDVENMAMYFAENKALNVAKKIKEEALIIGGDTLVYRDGILSKPKDVKDAEKILKQLSGGTHFVITGISVIHTPSFKRITEFEKTKVKFRDVSHEEIKAYISTKEPMDKAGAYAIQGLGSLFVKEIQGCYFNVVGLPIYRLSKILKEFGYQILK